MAALDKMGAYLRTLTVFHVKAAQTTDDVLGMVRRSNPVKSSISWQQDQIDFAPS